MFWSMFEIEQPVHCWRARPLHVSTLSLLSPRESHSFLAPRCKQFTPPPQGGMSRGPQFSPPLYPQIQAGFHEKLGGMCFINILCGMHMHFLFIKSKAADPPALIESSPWRLLSGAQVSSKKQHVHMNAPNGHMFEGVDPHPVPINAPLMWPTGHKSFWGDDGGKKKRKICDKICFGMRFFKIPAVVFCMRYFFGLFSAAEKPRVEWDLHAAVTPDRLDTTAWGGKWVKQPTLTKHYTHCEHFTTAADNSNDGGGVPEAFHLCACICLVHCASL